MKKGTLKKSMVETILKDVPESRNSDITLLIEIWKKYYPTYLKKGSTGELGIWLNDLYKVPKEDGVKRIRALIQNTENRYLPTLWSVAKHRHIKEIRWREYIRMSNPRQYL